MEAAAVLGSGVGTAGAGSRISISRRHRPSSNHRTQGDSDGEDTSGGPSELGASTAEPGVAVAAALMRGASTGRRNSLLRGGRPPRAGSVISPTRDRSTDAELQAAQRQRHISFSDSPEELRGASPSQSPSSDPNASSSRGSDLDDSIEFTIKGSENEEDEWFDGAMGEEAQNVLRRRSSSRSSSPGLVLVPLSSTAPSSGPRNLVYGGHLGDRDRDANGSSRHSSEGEEDEDSGGKL